MVFLKRRTQAANTLILLMLEGSKIQQHFTMGLSTAAEQCHSLSPLQIFQANTNTMDVVTNKLHAPLLTRFVRIRPQTWHSGIALRLELYGCRITGEGRVEVLVASSISTSQHPADCSILPQDFLERMVPGCISFQSFSYIHPPNRLMNLSLFFLLTFAAC